MSRLARRLCLSLVAVPLLPAAVQASPQADALLPQPVAPLSSQGQASAITRNPALLGAIGSWELDLKGYYGQAEPRLGFAFGAFGGFRPGEYLSMALGYTRRIEAVRTVRKQSTLLPPISELSFGLSLGNPNRLALGFSLHTTYQAGEKVRAPDLMAGLVTRWGNYLSWGSVFRHRPQYKEGSNQSQRSHSRWSNELALRPFGRPWLELAGSSHLLTRRSHTAAGRQVDHRWRWGGRLSATHHMFGLDLVARQRVLDTPYNRESDRLDPNYADQEWQWGLQLRVAPGNLEASLATRAQGGDLEAFALGLRMGPGAGSGHHLIPRRRRTLLLNLDEIQSEHDFVQVLEALRQARGRHQPPVLLTGRLLNLGWASAMELRKALAAYRDQGGRVFAHLGDSSLSSYYLASIAETIYVEPTGTFDLYEPGRRALYFKDALDRLSIRTEWMHTGPYKSVYERFTQKGPSQPDIEQRERIYALLRAEVLSTLASDRPKLVGIKTPTPNGQAPTPEQLRVGAQGLSKTLAQSPIAAPLAQELGLVDKVAYLEQSKDAIASTLGVSSLDTESLTELNDPEDQARPWGRGAYVGVVVVQGTIVSGDGFEVPLIANRYSGDKSFAKDLQTLADDPDCYAIMVRVNSPGGSAQASDQMWRSVNEFVQAQSDAPGQAKPLVVSMSDAAASGGYYLAAAAPKIFAQPVTITGSIGVTALHWDISQLAARVGVQTHAFGAGQARSPHSPFAPWTEHQRANMRRNIDAAYDLFVSKVHEGRNLSIKRVKELAGGRVWMGYDAKSRGLIDAWGGYEEARAWLLEQLPARKARQAIGLRVLTPKQGFLAGRLSALSSRFPAQLRAGNPAQAPAHVLGMLMRNVATNPITRTLLDLLVLPQQTSITWSGPAARAQDLGKH